MPTNCFVHHSGCGHSIRIEHGHDLWRPITIKSTRPLCVDCYQVEEDKIHAHYRTMINKASEMSLVAMTVAFEAEAKNNVGGSFTKERHELLVSGNRTVLRDIEALECERQKKLFELASVVVVDSTITQLA